MFTNDAGGRHKFFMVWNYVRQLRRWIKARQRAAAASQVSPLVTWTVQPSGQAQPCHPEVLAVGPVLTACMPQRKDAALDSTS